MKAIILAAGEGNRLRPYTSDRPKCMVEIAGRPMLDHQIDVLHRAGIKDIVLIKGYKEDAIVRPDIRTYVNKDFASTNMVWTLFCAEQELDVDTLICYGDIVYPVEAVKRLLESPHEVSVIIDRQWRSYWEARSENPLADAETLKINASTGALSEIGQKPSGFHEINGQYIGLMKFTKSGLGKLKAMFHKAKSDGNLRGKTPQKMYMTDILQAMIDEGDKLMPIYIDGGWIEVDTTEDLRNPITLQRLKAIHLGL